MFIVVLILLVVCRQIVYSLSSLEDVVHGELFHVDPDSGVLGIRQRLDHESRDSYTLTIEARDQGPGSIQGVCTVEVRVADENDNAPNITVKTYADGNVARIKGKLLLYATMDNQPFNNACRSW